MSGSTAALPHLGDTQDRSVQEELQFEFRKKKQKKGFQVFTIVWPMKLPIDYIDLQVLAICLQCKIGVSHLDSPALRFNPRREVRFHLDLVRRMSWLASILGRKPTAKALENQLVILQGLDGSGFKSFKNKPEGRSKGSEASSPRFLVLTRYPRKCMPITIQQIHRWTINETHASRTDYLQNVCFDVQMDSLSNS